jgi:predicted RNA-binding protein with RPS1 domain
LEDLKLKLTNILENQIDVLKRYDTNIVSDPIKKINQKIVELKNIQSLHVNEIENKIEFQQELIIKSNNIDKLKEIELTLKSIREENIKIL